MALDLYYSNFTNVGATLEKLYQSFLVDEKKTEELATKSDKGHKGKTNKNNENEDRKLQSSPERTTKSKKEEITDAIVSNHNTSVSGSKQNESKSTSVLPSSSVEPDIEQSPSSESSIEIES